MCRLPRTALVLFLVPLLAATLGMGATPVLAACGGGPCACGSTVDTDTTLDPAVDPVCSTDPTDTCPGVGLFVNGGIVLNLGGCTLRGAAGSVNGVQAGAGAQVLGAQNLGGRIIGFGFLGVRMLGDGGKVSNLQISDIGAKGIEVTGNSNRVEKTIVRRAAFSGVTVVGDDNVVSAVQVLDGGRDGVSIQGNGNTVEKTNALRNARLGIVSHRQ